MKNMIELPPLATNPKSNLIISNLQNEKSKENTLVVRMNARKSSHNFDSSASSTSNSRSLSSGGLLIKRSKTSNTLSQDGRLGPLFEQKSLSPTRRLQRTLNNQRLSNRSDYGSTITGPARSNNATLGSFATKRCVSSNDLSKMDKNNNKNKNGLIVRGPLYKHKSEEKLTERKKNEEKKEEDSENVLTADDETDDARNNRILDWLKSVEQFAEPPPEVDLAEVEDGGPPQTDTAIHIVYGAEGR